MELVLSHNSPTNTELSTSDGRVLYSISTPNKWTGRTTKLFKYNLSNGGFNPAGGSHELARIHWHSWRHSQLIYDGQMIDFDSFLHTTRMLSNSRAFVGPDGKSYKWTTTWRSCHLVVDEKNGATVADLKQKNLLGTKAVLEVDAAVLHMLDLVVITWIYFEKKRREDQTNQASAAASAAAASSAAAATC
ncbi:hypothetical protein PsYK624_041720 [Phanerochaete sordida]|uniref:DUF6593 domain-containing protein n=1 Tax=Phanerochaete sordida TaxID=48140 RepID=A0A9P3LB14_9APHY|nr:hypothetical protein PsYK624_041720 [Phanerochaete sordida]